MSGWRSTFTFSWKISSHEVNNDELRKHSQFWGNQTLKEGRGLVDEYERLLSVWKRRSPRHTGSSLNTSLDV